MPISPSPQGGSSSPPQGIGGSGSYPINTSNAVAIASGVTRFIMPGGQGQLSATETLVEGSVPVNGTFKQIEVRVATNANTGDTPFTLRLNNADTVLSVTYGNIETGVKRLATNVTATQGQTYSIEVTTVGAGAIDDMFITLEFEPS